MSEVKINFVGIASIWSLTIILILQFVRIIEVFRVSKLTESIDQGGTL